MIRDLIDNTYENMDLEDLYDYVEFYEKRQYQEWTDEQIETEYKERFDD